MALNDEVLRKIKRCMDLSSSSNENEAAIALKQMKSLMEKHGYSRNQVLAADVEYELFEINQKKRPPAWVISLFILVAKSLDCDPMISRGGQHAELVLIGVDPNPKLARYAFEVMLRKITKARKDYIKNNLGSYRVVVKRAKADAYAEGWVFSIKDKIQVLNPDKQLQDKINAYKDEVLGKSFNVSDKEFYPKSKINKETENDMFAGANDSSDVEIFVPTEHAEKNY